MAETFGVFIRFREGKVLEPVALFCDAMLLLRAVTGMLGLLFVCSCFPELAAFFFVFCFFLFLFCARLLERDSPSDNENSSSSLSIVDGSSELKKQCIFSKENGDVF